MNSSPAMLLARLANLGATVSTHGNRLRIETTDELSECLLAELRERKNEILPVARLLELSLPQFARSGQPLEVRVPWWPETLFFVPEERAAQELYGKGIKRERIWTAGELLNLLGGPSWPPEALRVILVTRRAFEGEVVQVLRGGEEAA